MKTEITVIGAGVIGVACAYYLRKAGYEVCLLDKGKAGAGSSHANCGLVSPSHAQPLTVPGVVAKGLKWMLRSDSPFYIKPELNLEKFLWLLKFAQRCNQRDMMDALVGRKEILNSSRTMFDDLLADEGMSCEWETQGTLFVFKQAEGMHGYETTNAMLAEHGLGARPYTGRDLQEFEPALLDDVYGAWHYEMDAHLKPDVLMSEWLRVVREMGVSIRENCEVLNVAGGKVITSGGEIETDKVVIATGAWSSALGKRLGMRLPVQPGKGYSITMNQPANPPRIGCLFQEVKMVATPFQSGYRLGGTMEFSGYDSTLNEKRMNALRKSAALYLKTPEGDTVTENWYGWRPMTWDGLPIIDKAPNDPNILIAAGHNMLGLSMAPATGKLITEMVRGEQPHIDASYYSYSRKVIPLR